MFDFEAHASRRRLNRALKKAPKEVTQELGAAFRSIGARFARTMTRERLRKSGSAVRGAGGRFVSNRAGDPRPGLFRRTGALARGLSWTVSGQGDVNALKLTTGWLDPRTAAIASVHENGGVIRPTNSKYLAVPLPAALTPAGVMRAPPRAWAGAFFMRSKKGNLLLVRRAGDGIEPLFALKESVKVPPRLEFVKTWESDELTEHRLETINEAVSTGLRKAGL